jgi:hypothetical protein
MTKRIRLSAVLVCAQLAGCFAVHQRQDGAGAQGDGAGGGADCRPGESTSAIPLDEDSPTSFDSVHGLVVAVDDAGTMYAAYGRNDAYTGEAGSLWLAVRAEGGAWTNERVVDAVTSDDVLMKVDDSGNVFLVFLEERTGWFTVAKRAPDGTWSQEQAAEAPAFVGGAPWGPIAEGRVQLMLDDSGNLFLVFVNERTGGITLAKRAADGTWSQEQGPNALAGDETAPSYSATMDASGRLYLIGVSSWKILLIERDVSGEWTRTTVANVVEEDSFGLFALDLAVGFAVGPDQTVYVSYPTHLGAEFDSEPRGQLAIRSRDGVWNTETFFAGFENGEGSTSSGLVVNANGSVFVAYVRYPLDPDDYQETLYVAERTADGVWSMAMEHQERSCGSMEGIELAISAPNQPVATWHTGYCEGVGYGIGGGQEGFDWYLTPTGGVVGPLEPMDPDDYALVSRSNQGSQNSYADLSDDGTFTLRTRCFD